MGKPPFCTRCQLELEPGAERCPRCLRKTTVIGLAPGVAATDFALRDRDETRSSFLGVRLGTLGISWCFAGVLTWVLFGHESWLEAHQLWLSTLMAISWAWLMPLRLAFRAPGADATTGAEAIRQYASLSGAVMGMGLLLSAILAGTVILTGSVLAGLVTGGLIFLVVILAGPPLYQAVRGKKPWKEAGAEAMKNAGIAILIVVAASVVVILRSGR
jgi:hypothetical protein